MKNKEIVKTGFEKYLDEFDERYRKNYKDKQNIIPILLNLFETYEEDIYTPSTLDKEMQKLQLEISDKLQEKLNQEENELLEQLRYCIGAETGELVEKAFIYGFCVAKFLENESKIFVKNKNEECNY